MTATVLRPVPTFEQVIRMPDPIIEKPDRVIQVSRPDPNIFAEHAERLGNLNGGIHAMHMHEMMMRQEAGATGMDINDMRALQASIQELNCSVQAVTGQLGQGGGTSYDSRNARCG